MSKPHFKAVTVTDPKTSLIVWGIFPSTAPVDIRYAYCVVELEKREEALFTVTAMNEAMSGKPDKESLAEFAVDYVNRKFVPYKG